MGARSRPSLTARLVALLRADVERPAVASGDAVSEDRLIGTLRIALPPPRLPGVRPYLAARTRFYDDALLRACESGITQVVLIAAGYDGRALRFRQPGVDFFELDHPGTQDDKRKRLADLGVIADDVKFAPVDLGHDDIAAALAEAGYDRALPTHFMCEGLTPYLPMDVLAPLLETLAGCAVPASTIAVDFLGSAPERGLLQKAKVGLVRGGVAVLGERMVTLLTAPQAQTLLADTGWSMVNLSAPGGSLAASFVLASRTESE